MACNTFRLRIALVAVALLESEGCQSSPKLQQTVLPAPLGTNAVEARHIDEGVAAYQQQEWATAKEHFETAIGMASDLAEAHYNLGMTFYRLGNLREGDLHFIKAANLAPEDKVIWDSPPLRSVNVPDKGATIPGKSSDGHMHSH